MARNILRVKLAWTGFQGAPGLSNFFFGDFTDQAGWTPTQAQVDAAANAVTTFAQGITFICAPGVTLQTQTDVDLLNDADGALISSYSAAAQLPKSSNVAAGSAYSAASGGVIDWKTSVIRRRRRIQGRTFVVPLAGSSYEGNGTLSSTAVTGLQNAANALVTGTGYPDFGVWGRPTRVKDANGKYTGEVTPDGVWAVATSARVPDMAAVLRSRRD